jgi:hypothetical protein
MVSVVDSKETLFERKHKPLTPQTWVTANTMLKVKRAIQKDGDKYTCRICQWTGSHRRTRIHTKQHFVRYACACGLLRVSRDAIYDHQISKWRNGEQGHGQRVGDIDEVDEYSFTEFSDRVEWTGVRAFPELPPTTTGATQRNRQSKSTRSNSAKGKAPARVPPLPELKVSLVRSHLTLGKKDLAEKLTNRHQPIQQFAAERRRRAEEMEQEADRLDDLAAELYRRSRRLPPQSEEYTATRREARVTEEEATHYRISAQRMRDTSR